MPKAGIKRRAVLSGAAAIALGLGSAMPAFAQDVQLGGTINVSTI